MFLMAQIVKLREELEAEFALWTADKQGDAHSLWQKSAVVCVCLLTWLSSRFELVTSDLSQQLCEQLRIILEPILATKLKGNLLLLEVTHLLFIQATIALASASTSRKSSPTSPVSSAKTRSGCDEPSLTSVTTRRAKAFE